MKRSTPAWLVAVILVASLVLVGCPGAVAPPGETKAGPKEPSGETSTPATMGTITQVTFERTKASGGTLASELRVGDGTTAVISCYPDKNGATDPVAAAAYSFASASGSILIPDGNTPIGHAVGIRLPLPAPSMTYTHLSLISITSTSPTAHSVRFSSAQAPTAEMILPIYASAQLVAGLLQSAAGAAESKLVLSGTNMTLSFQLAGNGPCPPPDAGGPVAPPVP